MPPESLPRAIATGLAVRDDDAAGTRRVSPRRVAGAAGVLAALYLVVLYSVHRLPDVALRWVGGGTDAFARHGGLHMVWSPPAGYAVERLRSRPIGPDMRLAIGEHDAVIEVARVAAADVSEVAHRLATGQVEMHEVLETEEMKQLAHVLTLPMKGQWPVDLEIDTWREPETNLQHSDTYLFGERAAIDAKLAEAAALGWRLPPHSHIAFEALESHAGRAWRTHVLADAAEMTAEDIETAYGNYDATTNRPIVLLDFTPDARERFGNLTARLVGHKLATTVGGDVRSAPIINARIAGGRAVISMGDGDATSQEHERDMLVATLRSAALPAGGRVALATYVPPEDGAGLLWLARIVIALAGGVLIGGVAAFVVHKTRPIRAASGWRAAGGIPWRRIGVTLLAPVALYVLAKLPVLELGGEPDFGMGSELAGGGGNGLLGMFSRPAPAFTFGTLGITPIFSAYILVELFALVVPGWRRRRHAGAVARQPLANAVIGLAIALVVIQGWFVTSYLEAATQEPLSQAHRLSIMGSLAFGTLVLAGVARLIRMRGLGNGYAALLAAGWLLHGLTYLAVNGATREGVLTLATLAAITIVVATVLRWRVGTMREPALRVPTSGTVALADAGGLGAVVILLRTLPPMAAVERVADLEPLARGPLVLLGLVGVLAVVWSHVFARPALRARLARRVGDEHPSREVWVRATALSAAALLALALCSVAARESMWLAEPATFAVVVAAVLDAAADLRGRRGTLVCVWSLQQPQDVDLAAHHLAAAEIPCHVSATGVRTLLAFFGPHVPMDVWVPPAHATAAEARLAALFAVGPASGII